jgi:hypothetical protein
MTDIKLKRTLATLTSLTPLTVFAHGEEVLVTVFLEFGLIVVFILILAYVKIRIEGKLIIGGLYLLTAYLIDKVIEDWPYRQNMTLINLLVTIIPATVFLMSYFALRKRFKKAD